MAKTNATATATDAPVTPFNLDVELARIVQAAGVAVCSYLPLAAESGRFAVSVYVAGGMMSAAASSPGRALQRLMKLIEKSQAQATKGNGA